MMMATKGRLEEVESSGSMGVKMMMDGVKSKMVKGEGIRFGLCMRTGY
jgi:hypothetical protein